MSTPGGFQRASSPAEIRGEDTTVLVYRPVPGIEINIKTSPRVIAVQQIMDGATLVVCHEHGTGLT